MPRRRFFHALLFSAMVVFLLGCGSVADKPPSNTGPAPGPTASPTPGSPPPTPPSGAEVRLKARGEAVINGVEAELRGSFERRPDRTRLDGQLEDINLPIGSAISFCLVQGSRTIPLAVGVIRLQDQRREAEFHIRTDEGQNPPNVQAGDVLQARNGANGNMADCSRPLLVAATFVPDDSSSSGASPGGSPGGSSGPSGEVRLRARGEAVINGVEAELRGEFRRRPDRTRLEGELEDINLPLGTLVSFCLVQGSTTIPLAVGAVQSEDGKREAEFSIRTDEGGRPQDVAVGNVLQARNGAAGTSADCTKPLLVSATFVPDN